MDLKQGIELLKANKTFKVILSTLRSVGSFLNGNQVKGFRLEYLSKVMEVKDTVHKHPLLYHICEMIIEKFPDTTDFFSEVIYQKLTNITTQLNLFLIADIFVNLQYDMIK